ncbi:MAG TPA: hypothetical protein VKZ18_09085 [Polyangia bacterium]|nr:hypothetical protein [Polyangia bacterium]
MSSVVYEPINRELRNVVAFFAGKLPDGMSWTVQSGQRIVPGATIGFWQWSDGTQTAIVAPPGCDGFPLDISDLVDYEQLGSEPSQLLLILH